MPPINEDIGLLTSANVHAGEYIGGASTAREQLDQCIGVINEAQRMTMAVLGEGQSQTLSDSVGQLNNAEAKVRYAIEILGEGIDAAHHAVEMNTEYIGRLTS